MATKSSSSVKSKRNPLPNQFIKDRIEQINDVFSQLEKEIEKVFKKVVKQGEHSGRQFKKNIDQVLKKIRKSDMYSLAQDKKESLEREWLKVSEDFFEKLKKLENSSNFSSAKLVIKDGQRKVSDLIERVEALEWVEIAKSKVGQTQEEVFSFLKIPTLSEVQKLERKVKSLESKIQILSRKAA